MGTYRNYTIKEESISKNKNIDISTLYELCVQELTAQQSKRDQIIAFYIAVISFTVPALLGTALSNVIKGFGFMAIAFIGVAMAFVIIRYRIYKEVYWISSRVISKLYNFDHNKIDKELLQRLFFESLIKSGKALLKIEDGKINHKKTFKSILNSAETMLFEVNVALTSALFLIGNIMIFSNIGFIPENYRMIVAVIIAVVASAWNLISWNKKFYDKLVGVYKTMFDEDEEEADKSFNAAYHKAWFLHFYID